MATCAWPPIVSPMCFDAWESARETWWQPSPDASQGLYVAALGTLKNGSVYTPLYSAFGPDPIVLRMTIAHARVLVTTDVLYRKKVQPVRAQMPALEHVLLVRETTAALPTGTHDFDELLAGADDEFAIPPTDPQDLALLHFTSGTTGKPKGAMHVHEAVVAHYATARFALDLHPADRFWCTANQDG